MLLQPNMMAFENMQLKTHKPYTNYKHDHTFVKVFTKNKTCVHKSSKTF